MSKIVIKTGNAVVYFTDASYPDGYGFLTYTPMTEESLDSGLFVANHHIDKVLSDPLHEVLE